MDDNIIEKKSRDFDSSFFVRALPNEYLVEIGKRRARPVLGGKRFRLFKRFMKIPASVQVIKYSVNNHSKNYQGIQVQGYACWRINPDQVEHAINTLDFYNAYDPMYKTSEDLKTICTEAIRHIVANMDIEDALKNKNEIAVQLKSHLVYIEERWGILFDQVGIETIKIMSDKVFDDLQAKERDKLRLDASLSRFASDREIGEAGAVFERDTKQTKLDTEKHSRILEFNNEKEIKEKELELKKKQLEMDNEFEARRIEAKNRLELKKLESQLAEIRKQKEMELCMLERDKTSLERKLLTEKQNMELEKQKREIENNISHEFVMVKLVEQMPQCLKALSVDKLDVHLGQGQIDQVIRRISQALKGGGHN